jgi:mono/diheme cytochrome c family protein
MGGGGMHRMHAMRHAMHHGPRGSADSAAPPTPTGAIPVCPALTRTLVDEGRAVFARRGNCTACHGADARGTPIAPDLSDATWLHADGTYFSIADVVASGVTRPMRYPAIMPAKGGADLAPMEVCAVAAYVHSLSADGGAHEHR